MKVASVKPRNKGSMVKLEREDGATIEIWCSADQATVEGWNGAVPAEYELRQKRDSTEQILVEKRSQGAPAYRNTKEAFELEAASRRAWQLIEEDRRDRRTALMQAIAAVVASGRGFDLPTWGEYGVPIADAMYRWLKDPGVSVSGKGSAPASSGGETGEASPPEHHVPGSGEVPSLSAPGPGHPGSEGEMAAGEDLRDKGESSRDEPVVGPAPSEHVYPVDPTVCDHKRSNGKPAKFTDPEGVARCQKCGTNWVSVVESTVADLGSA